MNQQENHILHKNKRPQGLFQDRILEAYSLREKLPEPTVCPVCHAIYKEGRWQWGAPPKVAHSHLCAACRRIQDHDPAGVLTLRGSFFRAHQKEIEHLLLHYEERQRAQHPMKRIMEMEDQPDESFQVTTTDMRLVRGMGKMLHHACQGVLEDSHIPGQNILRISWAR